MEARVEHAIFLHCMFDAMAKSPVVLVLSLVSWTPALKGRGLRLDSTATRHTARGVPLWLHGPTYPGT